ncbi:MAG: caspase family protein [Verrucomicrobia bacterium]|nr:caspase family protein [Cytophagales bacterium]
MKNLLKLLLLAPFCIISAQAQPLAKPVTKIPEMVYEAKSPVLNLDLSVNIEDIDMSAIGTMDGKNYALIIAVEDYSDRTIKKLDQPVPDATRLQKTLHTYYTFDPQYTVLLKNPRRTDIILAFEKMAAAITEKDNLLIFYAGHGYYDERLELGYWLPADAVQKDRSSWFPNTILRDYIKGIRSRHTLLVADACFSGGILKTRALSASAAIKESYAQPSRRAITSGALKEVPDKSVFIEYLIKRLEQNNAPFLPASTLYYSMKDAVINNSPNAQIPQYGEIANSGNEGGDFVFIRKRR